MSKLERNIERAIVASTLFLSSCAARVDAKVTDLQASATPALFRPIPTETVTTPLTPEDKVITLEAFTEAVVDGTERTVGVYAPGVFAYRVVQQPEQDREFVSPRDYYLTEFRLDKNLNTEAFLAHNFTHPGKGIANLRPGQEIIVINGKGKTESFKIQETIRVHALDPDNPKSDFVDLDTGKKYSAAELFSRIYVGKEKKVVFQTCIANGMEDAWGRLFVIGE